VTVHTGPEIRVVIRDESDVVIARRHTRELASQQGLTATAIQALATAVTEIARNIIVHAGSGEIFVASAPDATRRGVIVTALDTGPGILHIDRAMQDGFSTKGGLGFGLPGAQRLVDEFEIESTVGAGTRITLRKWGSAERAPAMPEVKETRRVLVADDEPELLRALGRLLRRADFEVVEADTGQRAIAALDSKPFDVILSDVHMPQIGGLELMRAVRRVDLDVPVILMSGFPDIVSAASAVEYGAFRYLTKPIDNEMLVRLVQYAARAHELACVRREAFAVTGAHPGAADRAGLEVRFSQAIDGLWMALQPIFDARSGALFGVESLMRSTELSMPSPQIILDAGTELERLPQLGRRVRALSAAAVAATTELVLFVNLHPDDLLDPDLIDADAALTKIASRVVLEITERTSLRSTPELSARLAQLRALGFRLAVDDIGAGYSGLTSFTELTPEIVKIDMSLVRDVHHSAVKQKTIVALCRLCHEVGCQVVGEGVETLEEHECLVALGCDLLQGFLLGRPSVTATPTVEPTA
jgi:EAL domain-containing protein (putative c-di-GMP-specific phosphodiesterase class I)/anti-sigma regulatory factor (Ser/Thr protein kinase)/CheY-like chemotaxis protein